MAFVHPYLDTIARVALSGRTVRGAELALFLSWATASGSAVPIPLLAQQGNESLPRTSAIEGVIVKASNGEPLRRASVRLDKVQGGQPESLSATTGFSGRFLFQNLTPGTYSIRASRQGFIDQSEFDRGQGKRGSTLELRPGESVRGVAVRLGEAVTLSGRVFDEAGEPLNGAMVGAMEYTWWQGRARLQAASSGQSNDLGEYRIFGLRPGRYYLYAQYPQYDGSSGGTDEFGAGQSYAPIFYPGSTDFVAAQRLAVRGGEDLSGLDFQLLPVPAVRVCGQVLKAQTGQAPHGGYLTLIPRNSLVEGYAPQLGAGIQDANGSFEFRGVPPGDYFVVAGSSEKQIQYHGRVPVTVGGADVEGVIVPITPGFSIDGQVRMEGNAPANSQPYVQLEPHGQANWGIEGAQVESGGRFSFKKVVEAEYRVLVYGLPGECYVKWTSFAGAGSSDAVVSITRDGLSPRLDILVSCSGGHIEGKVADFQGKSPEGLQVVLVPDSDHAGRQDLYKTIIPDERGGFSIDGIAPGDYKVYAWQAEDGVAFLDPDFADAFERGGESVRVGENTRSHVELRLIPVRSPSR